MQYTFFCCQGHLKDFLENYGFCQKSGSDTYGTGWVRGSCNLFYNDALRTKVDMWLILQICNY